MIIMMMLVDRNISLSKDHVRRGDLGDDPFLQLHLNGVTGDQL